MFFVALYNIAKFLIQTEQFKKELAMLKIAKKDKLALKVSTKKYINLYKGYKLKFREKSIENILENREIGKAYKNLVKNKVINHIGHSIFGEGWYIYKWGFVENFFWDHPIFDVMFHPHDKQRWGFLGQWLTIYNLPAPIRTGIRTFIFHSNHVKRFDFFFNNLNKKKELKGSNKSSIREGVNKKTRRLSFYMVKYLVDKNTNPQTISEHNKGIIKLIKLCDVKTQKYIIFRLNLLLLAHKGVKDLKEIVYRDLLTQWGEPVYIIRFVPNSPETGNFYLCELNLIDKTIKVWINNTWYRNHSVNYKWNYGYWLMYRCLATRNFGKLYNQYFKHYRVSRPRKTYKNYNFNGTKA